MLANQKLKNYQSFYSNIDNKITKGGSKNQYQQTILLFKLKKETFLVTGPDLQEKYIFQARVAFNIISWPSNF